MNSLNNTAEYVKAREGLDTGDIVLFSGSGPISRLIQLATRSKWSHIGMIICDHVNDLMLIMESTTLSKLKDIDTGIARVGVQIVPLSLRIAQYEGDIALRKVHTPRTPTMLEHFRAARQEFKGRPYEESKLELARSALGSLGDNTEEDLSSIFCSELVAEMWQRFGWLDEVQPSNAYDPRNFADQGTDAISRHLCADVVVGPLVEIK